MRYPTGHPSARRRTTQAILEAATHVLAEQADASLDDVAVAAGVGRATLFRHFPSRQALIEALHDESVDELGRRLADAGLDRVAAAEAVERIVRAVLVYGDRYRVLMRDRPGRIEHPRVEELIRTPIRAAFARGVAEGAIRDDLPPDTLLELFGGVVAAGIRLVSDRRMSLDDATADVTAFALGGLLRR